MFQFPGLAFIPYVFRYKYLLVISISLKTPKRLPNQSPKNIACARRPQSYRDRRWVSPFGNPWIKACSQLPTPNTLKALDRSHYRCPRLGDALPRREAGQRSKDHCCFKHIRERRGQAALTGWYRQSSQTQIPQGRNPSKQASDQAGKPDMFPLHDVGQSAAASNAAAI